MDKSTHEEHLSQPLQNNNKQFKIAVTFLTGYNGFFNVKSKNNKIYFARLVTGETLWITIPPGAYEIESLNNETKRIIIDEGHFTEADYPFQIKLNFSKFGSIVEVSGQDHQLVFFLTIVKEIHWDSNRKSYKRIIVYKIIQSIFCHLIKFFSSVISLRD